jgi:hypothetical protein
MFFVIIALLFNERIISICGAREDIGDLRELHISSSTLKTVNLLQLGCAQANNASRHNQNVLYNIYSVFLYVLVSDKKEKEERVHHYDRQRTVRFPIPKQSGPSRTGQETRS